MSEKDTPAPSTQMVGVRAQAIEDVLSALTAHELYKYRPKAFEGFIQYARETLVDDEEAKVWRSNKTPRVKPLEWVVMNDGSTYHAPSILGRWAMWEGHYLPPDGYGGIRCDDPVASAQDEYERRILAALTTEGQP